VPDAPDAALAKIRQFITARPVPAPPTR